MDRSHTAASCTQAFDRQRSCVGGWRQDEQVTAGMMLLVASGVFLTKVCPANWRSPIICYSSIDQDYLGVVTDCLSDP